MKKTTQVRNLSLYVCFGNLMFLCLENNKNVTNKTAKSQHHRPAKELQTIRRQQNEEDEDYIRRVNRITHESIKESQFEAKYGVDVIRNAKTNEITLKKRPVDDLEVQMKKAMRNKNADGTEKKKRNREPEVTLTAAERLKAAKEMIKKKKKEKQGNPIVEFQRDEVRFGEVVHGPPTLSMPRRAKKAETVARVTRNIISLRFLSVKSFSFQPGAKSSLLLHSVLKTNSVHRAAEGDGTRKAKAGGVKSGTVFKAIDLKGKRKELPAAARQMIEQQQQNVMNLYKEMKKKNRLENINISAVPE